MKIKIIDDLHPEDLAMLQALYSRSHESVDEHLKKVKEVGSGQFMDQYYVGYGHKSIGDCGNTAIFIEGVTMLAAKAIQDWPLYSGQEKSTRYIDFSTVEFANPFGTPEGDSIQRMWRNFYGIAKDRMLDHLRQKYPQQQGEQRGVWRRAINARCFDIVRSLLPAGAHTSLSWSTNLRQASDHLYWMVLHPDQHVKEIAIGILDQLEQRYPNSFTQSKWGLCEDWKKRVMGEEMFFDPDWEANRTINVHSNSCQADIPSSWIYLLLERPRGAELPHFMSHQVMVHSSFLLDFGSYRDLQRHRNGVIRMPLLTTKYGFNPWYLEQFPDDLRDEVNNLLNIQQDAIEKLPEDDVARQNYIAMGYQVPCQVSQGLPGFIYRVELRSSKNVHPSLRRVVHSEIKQFQHIFPDIALHVDMDPDSWTVRRGEQTIEEK